MSGFVCGEEAFFYGLSSNLYDFPLEARGRGGGAGGEQNPTKPPRPKVQTAGAAGEPESVFSETKGKSATFFLYAIKGAFSSTASPCPSSLQPWGGGQAAGSGTGHSPHLTYRCW